MGKKKPIKIYKQVLQKYQTQIAKKQFKRASTSLVIMEIQIKTK